MEVKRHKNGDYTLKAEPEDYNREGMLINVIWALDDCQVFGDEYCLGNALGMAVDLYDTYTDKVVRLPYASVEDLKNGHRVVLRSHKMDKWERARYDELAALGEL